MTVATGNALAVCFAKLVQSSDGIQRRFRVDSEAFRDVWSESVKKAAQRWNLATKSGGIVIDIPSIPLPGGSSFMVYQYSVVYSYCKSPWTIIKWTIRVHLFLIKSTPIPFTLPPVTILLVHIHNFHFQFLPDLSGWRPIQFYTGNFKSLNF